ASTHNDSTGYPPKQQRVKTLVGAGTSGRCLPLSRPGHDRQPNSVHKPKSSTVDRPGWTRERRNSGRQPSAATTSSTGLFRRSSHIEYTPLRSVRRVKLASRPSTATTAPATGSADPSQRSPTIAPVSSPQPRGGSTVMATSIAAPYGDPFSTVIRPLYSPGWSTPSAAASRVRVTSMLSPAARRNSSTSADSHARSFDAPHEP